MFASSFLCIEADWFARDTYVFWEQDDVTSVILTGGASRTPMIQAAVKAAVGEYVWYYIRD